MGFKRIYSTTVIVSDQDAAIEFYVGVLGFEVKLDNSMGEGFRFVTVAPVGAETELVLGSTNMFDIAQGKGIENGITLVVDSVDATYAELSAKGVNFPRLPEDLPWGGRGAWLADPDGNQFFLVENY